MDESTDGRTALESVAVFAAACAAYLAMTARDIAFGDGPELTTAAVSNGVAHPPGYPLWILIGHAASLVPAGTVPFRVNATSAVLHAFAVALVYAAGYVLVRRRGAALAAAAALALGSPLFVSWSLQAEVFALDDAFAAAIVLACVLWLARPARFRLAIPIAALFGLGLSNQQSLLTLAPLPLWAAWCGRGAIPRDGRSARAAALAAALLIAGFCLPYLHTLLVSQPPAPWHFGSARNLGELVDLIGRRAYGGFNLVARPADQGGNFPARFFALVSGDGWPIALSVLGLAALARARRYAELVLGALVVVPTLAFCAIANINVESELLRSVFQRFGLLSLTALAPFGACAVAAMEDAVPALTAKRAVCGAALAAVAVSAAFVLPACSLATEHGPRVLYTDIGRALPPHAILMTAGDPVDQAPQYFQRVEGWRPDVTVVTYGLMNYPPYENALRSQIAVPPGADFGGPQARRDALAEGNAQRPFYVTGERGIHAPGPAYTVSVMGVVSRLVLNGTIVAPKPHFAQEVALQSPPAYGDVPAARWQTNGMGTTVREYYAGGFFFTAMDAERLGERDAALLWYRRAQAYYPDPLIATRIEALGAAP